jgi:BCD family chlorophyll transporter-like MFS transporter
MNGLGWGAIVRLGLVQTSLGAIVVMMTSALNRIMVVELALPALVPGLLIGIHHAVQSLRPVWGHGSDTSGRRTPWILAGMGVLAIGGFVAALGVASGRSGGGLALTAFGFLGVGIGVGGAGTSVLATLASGVAPARRAGAATLVWVMMIFGFAITAPLAGHFLDPYTPARLVAVMGTVCLCAFLLSAGAVWGLEAATVSTPPARRPLKAALTEVWRDDEARRFTWFIFVSMLAYSAQELLVEPFAGLVFGLPPGMTTKLAGLQHGGVLIGMLAVAALASRSRLNSLRGWMVLGCLASAASLLGLAASGKLGADPMALRMCVGALGVSNGIYAVAAIGSMMGLAGKGARGREGARMGVWGAAQALAFALGGMVGTGLADLARWGGASALDAYAFVFVIEAAAFIGSGELARRLGGGARSAAPVEATPAGI